MRKLATLSMAVVASFALAGAASATMVASIVGSNLPGTNVYSIVMSFGPLDGAGGIVGLSSSVTTTGIYTGAFTDAVTPWWVLHWQLRWAAYASALGEHRLYGNLGARGRLTATRRKLHHRNGHHHGWRG